MGSLPRWPRSPARRSRRPDDPDDRAAGQERGPGQERPVLRFPGRRDPLPAIEVQAKNLIRISVLVKRPIASTPGMGGIVVRDSIGGEQFQFRTSDAIPAFSRVVLYRKAPVGREIHRHPRPGGLRRGVLRRLPRRAGGGRRRAGHSEVATTHRPREPHPSPPDPSLPAAATIPAGLVSAAATPLGTANTHRAVPATSVDVQCRGEPSGSVDASLRGPAGASHEPTR